MIICLLLGVLANIILLKVAGVEPVQKKSDIILEAICCLIPFFVVLLIVTGLMAKAWMLIEKKITIKRGI